VTESKEEAPERRISFTVNADQNFTATNEVTAALAILAELDSTPAGVDEFTAIEKVIGPFPADLIRVPLAERMDRLPAFSLRFKGILVQKFDGTAATTTCRATKGDSNALDTGFGAMVAFQEFVNPVPASERGQVTFTVTITACMPKWPQHVFNWSPPTVGAWVETLAHELILHGEPDVDGIVLYQGGTGWPYQMQSTQHWMFVRRGLPRYLLWLYRLNAGRYRQHAADFLTSLRGWAGEKEVTNRPPSVDNVLNGTPDLSNLRELAALLYLSQPTKDGDNAKLIGQMKAILSDTAGKPPLWWLPR
jgi:hypothetical protein